MTPSGPGRRAGARGRVSREGRLSFYSIGSILAEALREGRGRHASHLFYYGQVMKKIILTALLAAALLVSCKGTDGADQGTAKGTASQESAQSDTAKKPSKSDVSYAFGVALGTSLKETYVDIDYSSLLRGIKDVLEKDSPKVDMQQAGQTIQTAIMEAMAKMAEDNAAKEKVFLTENAKKEGVTTTASGLQYVVLQQGTGETAKPTDTVKVHYKGTFTDGKVFDSSLDKGEPAVFVVEQVISGWVEGLQLMNPGSKFKFFIPSALAYGPEGAGGVIPPNTPLIFEVELLSVEPPAAEAK